LLRREYYDPYDKPGQAELIVAKNRHGAVGSVNLSFRKEIARFENYTPLHTTEMEDQADTFAEYPTDNWAQEIINFFKFIDFFINFATVCTLDIYNYNNIYSYE